MKTNKRDLRLDIIRLFALFSVVAVHFFKNTNFYSMNVSGIKMYVLIILRSLFIVCVPLFIILTGYLMNKKELSKKYYKGLTKILIIYIICSIIYHLFLIFYSHTNISLYTFFSNLFSYAGTRDSWYVEFYIGLFLLIPFLNIIFNNLKSKKEANYLLLTLFFVIGLPSCVNFIFPLFPDWWIIIYPLFYYYLGSYLSKYQVKLSIKWNIILLILILFIDGTANYLNSYNSAYKLIALNNYSSGTIFITSFLVFNLLLKIKINRTEIKEKILKTLADAVFGAYLLSCIFDIVLYEHLFKSSLYGPLIVILVYVLSLISSMIINIVYNGVKNIFLKT